MSYHTSLSVKYSGRSLNFPPAQSTFEISLSEASSDQLRGAHIAQPLFMKSLVLLRSQRGASARLSEVKNESRRDFTPTPH